LNADKAFEAAARFGKASPAAAEGSTQPRAVSRQIRLLEDWLGVLLFFAHHRNGPSDPTVSELLAEQARHLSSWRLCAHIQNRA